MFFSDFFESWIRVDTYHDRGPTVNALSLGKLEVNSSAIVPECDYQTLT